MTQILIDHAIELIKSQRFGEALHLLRRAIDKDPLQWNAWYMAGQCCRFLDDTDGAIRHLSRAAELKRDESPIFLALGIAYQLKAQWDSAIDSFRRAIEMDSDYELAYNSLALTQKKCGELDKASMPLHGLLGNRLRKRSAQRNTQVSTGLMHQMTSERPYVCFCRTISIRFGSN